MRPVGEHLWFLAELGLLWEHCVASYTGQLYDCMVEHLQEALLPLDNTMYLNIKHLD